MDAWSDNQRHFVMVTNVERDGEGYAVGVVAADYWQPRSDGLMGPTCWVAGDTAPEAGDVVVLWGGTMLGDDFRGMALLDGTILHYISREDLRAKRQQAIEESQQRRRAVFEANGERIERDIAALPNVLQRRVVALRAKHAADPAGEDEWEWLEYEVFILGQGAAIAAAITTDTDTFRNLSWDEQRAMVPTLSDEHSGFTFSAAVKVAQALLSDPERLAPVGGAA